MSKYKLNDLVLGDVPMVVGTISTSNALVPSEEYICDIIEVRLDKLDVNNVDWLRACKKFESESIPVIATLRLKSDGGQWAGEDEQRREILSKAMRNLSIIDIEMKSVMMREMCLLAKKNKKSIIVSYHNFEGTNDLTELSDIISEIHEFSNAIPKIATMVRSEHDIDVLTKLLNKFKKRPLCIMGMGAKGTKTRTVFPATGSSLTYGYIDKPSAPGQLGSSELVDYLRGNVSEYNQSRIIRKKILE